MDTDRGNKIRAARRKLGLTQAELAGQVGASETGIRNYEAGKPIRPDYAARLQRILHLDLGVTPDSDTGLSLVTPNPRSATPPRRRGRDLAGVSTNALLAELATRDAHKDDLIRDLESEVQRLTASPGAASGRLAARRRRRDLTPPDGEDQP